MEEILNTNLPVHLGAWCSVFLLLFFFKETKKKAAYFHNKIY